MMIVLFTHEFYVKISRDNTRGTIACIYCIITAHVYIFSAIPVVYSCSGYDGFPGRQSDGLFPRRPNGYGGMDKQDVARRHHYDRKRHQASRQKKTYT